MKKLSGVRLAHEKHTSGSAFVSLPLPEKVLLPMSMHMGAPCTPCVKLRQHVAVGELVGTCEAAFSADIHASVSGTVTAITDHRLANGGTCKAVEITSDGKQSLYAGIQPPVCTDRETFLAAVRKSGAVGLGGAGFPTHIKLNSPHKIRTLLINAAECEPYITSDDRTMQEQQLPILQGIRRIMKILAIPECRIGAEKNKPAAISLLTGAAKADPGITVVPLSPIYPQGAEKVLIYHLTGKVVREGQLPAEQGVIVLNVSTLAFLETYFTTGIPLVNRSLTVDGDAVNSPCNVTVPIGTPIRQVLTYAGCDFDKMERLIGGGPMMGNTLYDADGPITKTNNALLAMTHSPREQQTACIRCGRCVQACPMKLMPTELERAFRQQDVQRLKQLHLSLCMLCGCCSYVCPARRPLTESHRLAKDLVRRNGGK